MSWLVGTCDCVVLPLTRNGYPRTIMAAKGLFADTLSGVGPDPNTLEQQKSVHLVEPVSSVVSTWRGSGERVVIHVDQTELPSLVSTQRGSGTYAALVTVDYQAQIVAGQTLPLGTRVDPQVVQALAKDLGPPITPRLSSPVVEAAGAPRPPPSAPSPHESLLPNVVSLPVAAPSNIRQRRGKRSFAAAGLIVLCVGLLAIPIESHPQATLVPVLASPPHVAHALTSGIVGKVHVSAGETVFPGQALVSLDEHERNRETERLKLRIDQLENELEQLISTDQRLHTAALGALRKKRALLVDRLTQHEDQSSTQDNPDTQLHLQQQLADVDFLRNDRQRAFEQRKRTTEAALSDANAELLHLNSIELTTRATVAARVNRVLVQPGQLLALGDALLEATPSDASIKLVGFVPDEAARRINPTDTAQVDVSTLSEASSSNVHPVHDAHLTYVANTLASQEEVQGLLGLAPTVAVRRIELAWPVGVDDNEALSRLVLDAPKPRATATFTAAKEALGVRLYDAVMRLVRTP
jgi:multidrug resistance efflux pump